MTSDCAAVRTILIIDDDDQLRGFLSELLSSKGFEIHTAKNGLDGLNAFRENKPDLVLTDIVMPEKEGLELIKLLKKEDPAIHIIAMTGGGNYGLGKNYLQLAEVLGASKALSKPFRTADLLSEIEKLGASNASSQE